MGILIGPTPWWQQNLISVSPVGTTLPDGSIVICKAGGAAWIVAPSSTQVSTSWNGTTTLLVGNKCCVCDWPTLNTRLIACGFNPSDWFVPSCSQVQNPGFVCRVLWSGSQLPGPCFWSSTESSATAAVEHQSSQGAPYIFPKSFYGCMRAFRCVTY
jgi:hypothetical protein